jgi:2-polyprenyl-3-methyl-5-hydroxy-6-metoxy-1,4-benzoquinol methylase
MRSQCPCCHHTIDKHGRGLEGSLNTESTFEQIRDSWIGIGLQRHFNYYQCPECKSLSNISYPDNKTIEALYSSMPRNMEEAVSLEHQKQNQSLYAHQIANHAQPRFKNNKDLSILEIGADCGLLIESVSDKLGSKFTYSAAIEPNTVVRPKLISVLMGTSKKYTIANNVYTITPENDGFFDIIVAIHVFDHVFSIRDMLIHLKGLLKIDGFIYFVVHNPQSKLAWFLGEKWPPYCPQHPQLYTQRGIKKLADSLDLKLLKTGKTTNKFSLAMITNFLKIRLPFADSVNLSLPLGNRYYILTAK